MLAFVGSRISPHMAEMKNGALVCLGVPIARDGEQMYKPEELGISTADRMVKVVRPGEEVFDRTAMSSFEAVPLCDSHPGQFVQPTNWKAYSSGHCQNVREGPRLPDGTRQLVADLVIHDSILKEKVLSGMLRDVSCAYDCEYRGPQPDGSYVQTKIRGNHVAVVAAGRAQTAKILDSSEGKVEKQISPERALLELGKITALLERQDAQRPQAMDHMMEDRRFAAMAVSPEAQALSDWARRFHRRALAAQDCRPALRQAADERRELTPQEEDAREFAESMRAFHRK